MSSSTRAWVVAASVGVVEALKDQGVFRWNHTIRSVQQYAKSHARSALPVKKLSSPSSAAVSDQKWKQSEESLRTVMSFPDILFYETCICRGCFDCSS